MNSFENEKENDEMKNLVESTSSSSSTKSSRKSAITLKQPVKRRDRALSISSFVSSLQNVVEFSSSSIVFSLKKKRKMRLKIKNVDDSTDSSTANVQKKKKNKDKKLVKRISFVSFFFRLFFDYEKNLELNANVK